MCRLKAQHYFPVRWYKNTAMIIETGERNYSAYVPDVPGCVATGKTVEEVRQRMRKAIELHLEGMREDGLPIPKPTSLADYV